MNAQSNQLSAIADNIANATTNGYKRGHIEFSSFIPSQATSSYQSGSVESNTRHFITEQGNLTYTTSTTDLAVQGKGFFLVDNTSDQTFLTRAGSFVEDGDGYLVNAGGFFLMGYPTGTTPVVNGTAGLEKVALGTLGMQASATTAGTFYANVPSTASIIAAGSRPSDNVAGSTWTATSSLVVYDNLGGEVTLDIYWAKTATNAWEITIFDHADATAGTTPFPYGGSGILVTSAVTFSATDGSLLTPASGSVALTVPGGQAMTLDISECTQLAASYTVLKAEANGSAPSALDHIEIDTDGDLYAVFQNGARVLSYQIPLAFVTAADNLTPEPGDVFSVSVNSGDLQIGTAGSGGLGLINSSALEQSTVDLATELANMIESQRVYEINSRVFNSASEIYTTIVALGR